LQYRKIRLKKRGTIMMRERKALFFEIVSLILLVTVIPCYGQLQDSAWPGFKRDIRHTGRTTYVGPANPHLKWSYPVNMSERVGPSLDRDGIVYIGAGESEHALYAINPDGTLKWTYSWSASDPSAGVPAINHDGTVYISQLGKYESDWAGRIHAVNSDGTLKWIYKVPSGWGTWMATSPSVDTDGTIYIPDYNNSPSRGGLSAINPDGTLKWYYGISTSGSERDPRSAVVIDDDTGHLYFGASCKTGDNRLLALDRNGQLLWSYTTGGPIPESPAVGDDGTVYFGSRDGKLYALDADGNLKWSLSTGGEIDFSPTIGWDNTIYVGSKDGYLYAVNPDGTMKWSFKTDGPLYGSAAVDGNDNIYFGSYDNNFYSLTPDGTLRWKFLTEGKIVSPPAIGQNGTIYFSSFDGYLYALQDSVSVSDISGCINLKGSPVVHRRVALMQRGEPINTTITDADGCYTFERIASGKHFVVAILGPEVP
jgi:outer membrane protein assembly factor BamB